MHPPKVESFDIAAGVNVDNKGIVRRGARYRRAAWGLHVDRPADHPLFHRLESWLVPDLGLRVSIFHPTPGTERGFDRYLDVGVVTPGADAWGWTDHYLDITVATGTHARLLDVDELIEALGAGLVDPAAATAAVENAARAVDGVAAHGYSVERWFAALGRPLTWGDG